ncbi:MAG: S1 RNA-binding domain-containing protein [archaeon]
MKLSEWPSLDELVIVQIKRITNYGAFADLVEYSKEGFIHISNVSSSWVKNIRNFLSENELRVAKVIKIDKEKNMIDLSLRAVSDSEQKQKLEDWKREKRADKLFERICKELRLRYLPTYKKYVPSLIEKFGDLYSVFENVIMDEKSLDSLDLPDKIKQKIIEIAKANISPTVYELKGNLVISSMEPNGIEIIKNSLLEIQKNYDVSLQYVSAPKYLLKIKSLDPQKLDKVLANILNDLKTMLKGKGSVEFERVKA